MKRNDIIAKIQQAEAVLGFIIPTDIKNYISDLKKQKVKIGTAEWSFKTWEDKPKDKNSNYIIKFSKLFQEVWETDAVVLAEDDENNYLILMPDEDDPTVLEEAIFIAIDDLDDIQELAPSIKSIDKSINIIENPLDYESVTQVIQREIEHHEEYNKLRIKTFDNSKALPEYDKKILRVMNYMQNERKDKIKDILSMLEEIEKVKSPEAYKFYALLTFFRLYHDNDLTEVNYQKAHFYNDQLVAMNEPIGYINFAEMLIFGEGIEPDQLRAYAAAKKAERLLDKGIAGLKSNDS